MVRALTCGIAVFLLGAAVCLRGAETETSETLLAPAREMIAEIFENMKSERRLPPNLTPEQLKARSDASIDTLKKMKILDVSVEQEKKFKKGEFDDAENLKNLGEMIALLKKSETDLPAQTVFAIRHYEAMDLKGARLELCRRIVSFNVEKLRALAGEGASKK